MAFRALIDEMILAGIIEESNARGTCPAILVPKPNKTSRLVVDYRTLNRILRRKLYPMPRVDDYLEALRGNHYFASMDLSHGYYQILLDEEERPKTAFTTPDGVYQYRRMPMGLADSPCYFQAFVNKVLGDLAFKICLGYFDDIPIMARISKIS